MNPNGSTDRLASLGEAAAALAALLPRMQSPEAATAPTLARDLEKFSREVALLGDEVASSIADDASEYDNLAEEVFILDQQGVSGEVAG